MRNLGPKSRQWLAEIDIRDIDDLRTVGAVEAYARAVEKAGSVEADKVKAVLDSFSNEELLIGPTTFEPDLHINLNRPMLLMEMTNGKYTAIGRFSAEQVERPKF